MKRPEKRNPMCDRRRKSLLVEGSEPRHRKPRSERICHLLISGDEFGVYMESQGDVEAVIECPIVDCGNLESWCPQILRRGDVHCERAKVNQRTVSVGAAGSGGANRHP